MPLLSFDIIDRPARMLATCRTCKVGYRLEVRMMGSRSTSVLPSGGSPITTSAIRPCEVDGSPLRSRSCCGSALNFRPVKGALVPSIKCDARCSSSKGPRCECACGGACHGSGLAQA
jgi:hypothetical protein